MRENVVELVLLTLSSILLTMLCCGFLMIFLGPVPVPITALIAMAGNWLIFALAAEATRSKARFVPMIGAALVVLLAMMPGSNNSEAFIWGLPMLLMILLGLALPVFATSVRFSQPVQ